MRQYGHPVGAIARDAVLEYTLPQAYPDSQRLAALVGPDARIGYRTDAPDQFMLPSLSYPIGFYELYPRQDDWRADEEFVRDARAKGLTHVLLYTPPDRVNPFALRSLR